MSNVPVIVFGPNEESFYIGLGMSYFAPNMPSNMQGTINKWPAIQLKWLSIQADGSGWAAKDGYSGAVEYCTKMPEKILESLKSSTTTEYISFGCEKHIWSIVQADGSCYAHAEDGMFEDNIDGFQGFVFGKGATMILVLKKSFVYNMDDEAKGGKLQKLLDEYINREPKWTVEWGSSLCFYNIDYFFLKFKNTATGEVMMHWNLPPTMAEKLAALNANLNTAEAQTAIRNHEMLRMQRMQNEYNLMMQANMMIANATQAAWMNSRLT